MMDYTQAVVLGLVQGLTEFLPVSSSAHLILVPTLTGWVDQGLAFDVAVHFGTLFAIVTYFRQDIRDLWQQCHTILRQPGTFQHTLIWKLMAATLPTVLIGLLCHDLISSTLRTVPVIIGTTLCFGLLLGVAEYYQRRNTQTTPLTQRHAWLIGLAQVLALIPGTSRSGVTLTAGLLLGLNRTQAARFSFLMAIPIITLACVYETFQLVKQPAEYDFMLLLAGGAVALVSAYCCIHLFLKWINKISLIPFVVYRVALACLLVFLF